MSGITRRHALQLGAAGITLADWYALRAFGESLSGTGTRNAGRAKSCIVLFSWGGMSHLDTWDLKPEAPKEVRGEFTQIATSTPGVFISEHMPQLARQTHRLAIVRSVHHAAADHREAAYWNLTGHRPRLLGQPALMPSRQDWPSLGSQVARALFVADAPEFAALDPVEKTSAEKSPAGTASTEKSPPTSSETEPKREPIKVLKTISLSTDVLKPGRFPVGAFDQQNGYTNQGTVELIGMISEAAQASVPLTRQSFGPTGDFQGMIAGNSTAGDWGCDTHGRGGNLYLPGEGEEDAPHSGFGCHANKFITFDLNAIRTAHFGDAKGPLQLTGKVGVNGAPSVTAEAAIQGGVWIDGRQVALSEEIRRDDPAFSFRVYCRTGDRYLTLAALNGPGSTHYDDIAFRNVNLALVSGDIPEADVQEAPPPITQMTPEIASALPKTISLPYPIADRGLLNGQYGGFLGSQFDPVYVRPAKAQAYKGVSPAGGDIDLKLAAGVSFSRVSARRQLLAQLESIESRESAANALPVERNRAKALNMLMNPSVRAAFDLRQEPQTLHEAYGQHICGQSTLMARRLSEAGVPLVTVYCSAGDLNGSSGDNWDTHGNNFNRLKNDMLPPLDQAGSALLEDLATRGRLEDTLVVFLTEFGRTPNINGGAGRDHFPGCYSVAFAGGGIQGGQVYGLSDGTGTAPSAFACGPEDVHATIFHALGIDPHFEIQDLEGRPFPLCLGRPLPIFGA